MPIPLKVSFHGLASSEALETHIREKVETLGELHPNLTRCNVTIEQPHHHKHQGNAFNVRIDLYVPGDELVVNRDAHEDAYVALREAFEAARRQVVRHAQKKRGDVKRHSLPGGANKQQEADDEEGI
jgi:ribosomal subunit interface protein